MAIEETFGAHEWEQGGMSVLGLLRRKAYIDRANEKLNER